VGNPGSDTEMSQADRDRMAENAARASNFLKAISHEGRLMILCHLSAGEKSVTELEELLSARQAAVSQQLSRLRLEGLVTPRRDGKTIYYRLADDRPQKIMEVVYDMFCTPVNTAQSCSRYVSSRASEANSPVLRPTLISGGASPARSITAGWI
jgi:DNA-binding transcriptional ArsR family regulator